MESLITKNFNFTLKSIDMVKNFVSLTTNLNGAACLRSGRYIIDAKSIMGIFSLDLTKEINCEVEASKEEITKFVDGLKKYGIIE